MARWRARRSGAQTTDASEATPETAPEPAADVVAEPAADAAAEPASTLEPEPEAEPEAADATTEQPAVEDAETPVVDEPDETPTAVVETVAPETDGKPAPEPEAKAEPEPVPAPEPEAKGEVEPAPVATKTKRQRRWKRDKNTDEKPDEKPDGGTSTDEADGTETTVLPATDRPETPGGTGDGASDGAKSDGDVLVAEAPPKLSEVPDDALVVGGPRRRRIRDSTPVLLFRAAHPRQAAITALAMGGVAAVAGRPSREAAVVLATVLVGQTILGWHNDVVDRRRDARHKAENKPVADGRLDPGSVWYALAVGVLVLVPLSITTGITAGIYYLLSVAVAMLGHYVLRTGFFSWVPWAASFALLPPYLTLGGWGGQDVGAAPQPAIVVLAALLGIGVHMVRAVWGLVADHADEWTYLPLKLGLKLGATRLLTLGTVYIVAVVVAMAVVGAQDGLAV